MRTAARRLASPIAALLVCGCGGAQRCPEIDEEAIAERAAEIVFQRFAAEAQAAENHETTDDTIAKPEPKTPAIGAEIVHREVAEEEEPEPVYHVPVDGSPFVGPDNALVTIVMFADIQCHFCDKALRTVKAAGDRFGDEVRIVWKNHPLPFHREALLAHHALMETHAQQGDAAAFEMLELMFQDLTRLGQRDLEQYARKLKLSLPRFRKALRQEKHAAAINRDLELARRIGVRGTPTFFINGNKQVGAAGYYTFFAMIGDALERAQALVRSGVPRNRVYDDIIGAGIGRPAEP